LRQVRLKFPKTPFAETTTPRRIIAKRHQQAYDRPLGNLGFREDM
jgi:hypothetical protein